MNSFDLTKLRNQLLSEDNSVEENILKLKTAKESNATNSIGFAQDDATGEGGAVGEALNLNPSSPQITQYWEIMVENQPEDVVNILTNLTSGKLSYEEFLNDIEADIYDSFRDELNENINLDPNKLSALVKALSRMGGNRDDREDYKAIAKLLSNNQLAKAAEYIKSLDTSPNEFVYEIMDEIYPELWDMLFDLESGEYIALSTPKNGLEEGQLDEMASFYKLTDDSPEAKAALQAAKEKFKPGTTLYNTLDTLEKKGEIDYKELAKQTGKDMATFNNPKSREVLEKDLAAYIQAGGATKTASAPKEKAPKEKAPKLKITNPKPTTKLADLVPSGLDAEEAEMEKQALKAAKGNKRLGTNIEKLAQVTKEMKALAKEYQAAKGTPEETDIVAQLKALTAEKRALEKKTTPKQMTAADLMGGDEL